MIRHFGFLMWKKWFAKYGAYFECPVCGCLTNRVSIKCPRCGVLLKGVVMWHK